MAVGFRVQGFSRASSVQACGKKVFSRVRKGSRPVLYAGVLLRSNLGEVPENPGPRLALRCLPDGSERADVATVAAEPA